MNANETEALVSSVGAQWTRCNSNFPTEETRKQHAEGRAGWGGSESQGFVPSVGGGQSGHTTHQFSHHCWAETDFSHNILCVLFFPDTCRPHTTGL